MGKERAVCPSCGMDLVQCLLVIGSTIVYAWLCDCASRIDEEIRDAVVTARNYSDEAVAMIAFGTGIEGFEVDNGYLL